MAGITWYETTTDSDLNRSPDGIDKKLLTTSAIQINVPISVGAGSTKQIWTFSEPNIPNNSHWETGDIVIEVRVESNSNWIFASTYVGSVDSLGNTIEQFGPTSEQQLATGGTTYLFTHSNVVWAAGSITDRFTAVINLRNNDGTSSRSTTIGLNGTNSQIITEITQNGPILPVGKMLIGLIGK